MLSSEIGVKVINHTFLLWFNISTPTTYMYRVSGKSEGSSDFRVNLTWNNPYVKST